MGGYEVALSPLQLAIGLVVLVALVWVLLKLLGLEHTKLTYRYAGRDFRLTDVFGEVVKDILA